MTYIAHNPAPFDHTPKEFDKTETNKTTEDKKRLVADVFKKKWPNPDLSTLNGGAYPAPPFPKHLLSDDLVSLILSLAAAKGTPPDYVFTSILSVAASLIGNARTVNAFDGWREPIALWVCLVGGPSSGKTPALDPAIGILKKLEEAQLPGHQERFKEWQEQSDVAAIAEKVWKAKVKASIENDEMRPDKPDAAIIPPQPIRPRRMISDITQERAAELLCQLPKGVCLFRDELAGLIEGCGRYGNDSDRQFFLEAWNGKPFTVDRVSKPEPIIIDRLLLSICGGIQPDRLNSLFLNADNDGLASRFLFVWPEPMPPLRPTTKYDLAPLKSAFEKLDKLDLQEREEGFVPTVIKLNEQACIAHQQGREWLYEHYRDAPGLLGSFTGKIPGMVMRLAAVLDLLDWSLSGQQMPPTTIGENTIDRCWRLFEDYFIPMASRVYGDAGVSQPERHAKAIAKEIMKRRELSLNARNIRKQWKISGLSKAANVDKAIEILIEAGWLLPKQGTGSNTIGRPAKDYWINPDLFNDY